MALYGIHGKHSVEACPLNDRERAERLKALHEGGIDDLAREHGVNEVIAQYHSGLEHTLLWVVDADDAHRVQGFCIASGLAAFNELKIVPLITFGEGVVPLVSSVHGL